MGQTAAITAPEHTDAWRVRSNARFATNLGRQELPHPFSNGYTHGPLQLPVCHHHEDLVTMSLWRGSTLRFMNAGLATVLAAIQALATRSSHCHKARPTLASSKSHRHTLPPPCCDLRRGPSPAHLRHTHTGTHTQTHTHTTNHFTSSRTSSRPPGAREQRALDTATANNRAWGRFRAATAPANLPPPVAFSSATERAAPPAHEPDGNYNSSLPSLSLSLSTPITHPFHLMPLSKATLVRPRGRSQAPSYSACALCTRSHEQSSRPPTPLPCRETHGHAHPPHAT